MNKRYILSAFLGGIWGLISFFVGEFDGWMQLLLIVMLVDYILGVIAAYRGLSPKTSSGKLSSSVARDGLLKKVIVILLVGVTYRVEVATGTQGIRTAVVIAFCANEFLSMLENSAVLGVVIPDKLRDALDIFNKKGDDQE